jgi:hypothetical protein
MKRIFFIALFALVCVNVFSQSTAKTVQEYYVCNAAGNRISKGFSYLSSFNDYGVAVCVLGGKRQYGDYGLIINGKFGLIKEDGTYLVEPSYSYIEDFDTRSNRYIFTSKQKSGILDENGKIIVEPEYDVIESSYYASKKFIAKKTGESAKVLDHNGKLISKTYQEVYSYDYGFQTLLNGQYGLLSNDGREILPNSYSSITPVNKKIFFVEDFQGNKLLVDDKNNQLTKTKYSDFKIVYENGGYYGNAVAYLAAIKGRFGLLDLSFNTIHPFSKELMEVINVNNTNYIKFKMNGKWGMINLAGKEIVKPIYNDISVALEKVLIVSKGGKVNEWGGVEGAKYGVIDENGKERIKLIYDDVKMYYQNIVTLKLKDNWHAFDKNLNKLFSEGYAFIDQASENTIIVNKGGQESNYAIEGGVYGLYNLFGELIIPINYNQITSKGYGQDQIFLAKKNGKYGVINQEGKVILDPTYEEMNCSNEICIVGKYNERSTELKYGLLYSDGSETNLLTELKYDAIQRNHGNETWTVKVNNSWGIISNKGKEIIPSNYFFIEGSGSYTATDLYKINENGVIEKSLYDNSFTVQGGAFGLVNSSKELLLPLNYSELEMLQDSLVIAKTAGTDQKAGIFNIKTKKWIVPVEYEYLKQVDYQNSLFMVGSDVKLSDWGGIESGKMGVVDLANKLIVPMNYSEIRSDNSMLICNSLDFSGFDLYDSKGNLLLSDYDVLVSIDDTLVFYKKGKDIAIYNIRSKANILSEKFINGVLPEYISRYSSFSAAVQNSANKWGFVNKLGKTFIPCQYDNAKASDDQFLIVAKLGAKNEFLYGVVDLNNDVVIPFEYENIEKEYGNNFLCTKENTIFKISRFNQIIEKKPYSEINN